MSHAPNPYAPPKNDDAPPVVSAEVAAHEAIRREHINAETNVKTIGSLMYLGALGCLLNAVPTLTTEPLIAVTVLAVGVALGWGGYWLRRLDPRGRTLYTVIAALGMVGTLAMNTDEIAIWIGQVFWPVLMIALLWAPKASLVMTPHYREVVVSATPHVKRKTSLLVILLAVILIAVLFGFILSLATS